MIRRRLLALTSVGLLAAAAMALPANGASDRSTAAASQPFVTPIGTDAPASDQHVAAHADQLGDAASDVVPLVADTIYSLGHGLGFAGQSIDTDTRSIDLYWQGSLPDAVSSYIATNDLGVKVTVHENAALTRAQEQAASTRLIQSDLVETAGITSVAANHDGTGIRVQLEGSTPSTDVQDQIVDLAGIQAKYITYEENVGKFVYLASRANDTSPWKGGSRIVVNGHVCSTGFAALSGAAGRLLSANHCDPAASHTIRDGGGTTIATGSGVVGKPSIDSQSIDPSASPATTPRIYIGSWNSSLTSTVKNWASNWDGDIVCSGGASTGSHCGTIIDDAVAVAGLTGHWYVKARAYGSYMAGGGDSGGPIYRTVSTGVQARGTLIGGYSSTATTCGYHNPDSAPTCYRDIAYVPISVVLNSWGYALEVG